MKVVPLKRTSVAALVLALSGGAWGFASQANRSVPEPFQIFDNLYYIGLDSVSAYLVTTNDGLIVIDSTFADTAEILLENIGALGFSPTDVRYIFISHGHLDHAGGASRLREATGARVGMSAPDWQMTGMIPDLVIGEGQAITVG